MLISLQYVRAVAALMVIGYHLMWRLQALGWQGSWPGWLSAGVDLFFVLSGFIMWATTSARPQTPATFAANRLARIVPLYWLVTLLVAAVSVVSPHMRMVDGFSWGQLATSLAFFPQFNPGTKNVEPLIPQGWTLNMEMMFYAIFTAALFLDKTKRLLAIAVPIVGLFILGIILNTTGNVAFQFYTSDVILEFLFGVILAVLYARLPKNRAASVLLIVAGFTLFAFSPAPMRVVRFGLPAAAIITGCLMAERRAAVPQIPALRLIGDASYSIYLTHGIILSVVEVAWHKVHSAPGLISWVAFSVVASAVAIALGIACHLFVEKPMLALLRPRSAKPAGPGKAALRAEQVA